MIPAPAPVDSVAVPRRARFSIFHASIRDLRPGQARVLRLRQRVDGELLGGYSVVLIGPTGGS